MNRKHFALLLALTASVVASHTYAQNGINIPFSQYGTGFSSMPYSVPFASQMGGVVYTRQAANIINPFNPASYAAIQPTSFVFNMGIGIEMSTFIDPSASLYDADGNIAYLAMGFPLSKWWKTAIGILPLTTVSYESVQTQSDPVWGENKTSYEGVGGLTKVFWGHGFNITDRLSVGLNANFLFDHLSRAITYHFPGNDSTYIMDARREKTTNIHNFTFDMGLQYTQPIGEDYTLLAGLTFIPHRIMDVTDNSLIYTFVTYAATEYIRDTIFPLPGQSGQYTSTLEQPYTVGIGLALQRNDIWSLAFDATYAPWSGLKYTENEEYNIFGASALRYGDNFRGAVGIQRLGDKNAQKYMRRVTYSGGFHYEMGKLQLQPVGSELSRIDEWGIGFGMSLPMRKGRSVLDFSLNYSSMGSEDLLRRNYFIIGIGLGSSDTWFQKRKYN